MDLKLRREIVIDAEEWVPLQIGIHNVLQQQATARRI